MKVCFADGVRDFRVGRVYAETEENRLELVLEDECYPFRVRLCYEVFEEEDVIKKWRIVENTGGSSCGAGTYFFCPVRPSGNRL